MKANLIKVLGTIAAMLAGSGAVMLPTHYQPLAAAIAGLVLGWLHLPQPKVAS